MTSAAPQTPPDQRAAAARDIAVQLVGRVGNLLLGVVATVLIVRTLGVEGNGRWATLLAVQAVVGTLGQLGLEPTAVRRAAATPAEEAGWLGALLVLRLLLAVPAGLLTFAISAAVLHDGSSRAAAALIGATLVAGAPMSFGAVFGLRMRNDRTVVVATVNSVVWLGAVVGIAIADGGLVAFAAGLFAATAVTSLVQAVWVLRDTEVDVSGVRRHGRRLLTTGAVLGVGAALTFAYARVDQLLVLHYNGDRDAGLYGTAYLLLERLQFLPAAVMATTFPLLSAAWPADPERARRLVAQIAEAMLLISLPVLAFTTAAARPMLVLLFGTAFADAADVLPVLMLAFVTTCFGFLLGYLSLVVERQRAFLWISLLALAFNVVANAVLLPREGYQAAAWITVATELIVLACATRVMLAPLGLRLASGRTPRTVLAAVAVGLAVFGARQAGLGAIGLGAVAAVVYPAAAVLLGAVTAEDRARLLSRSPRRTKPEA